MLKFSIYYPYTDTAKFDMDYYQEKHVPLVQTELKEEGMEKLEVVLGQAGMMNKQPHFIAVANLYFKDAETMGTALKNKGGVLVSDIQNFTDVKPLQEIAVVFDTI